MAMQSQITLLTSGTRGDVAPYIALALGLQQAGLQPQVVTHPAFSGMVSAQGIPFASLGENPTDLMTRPGAMPLTYSGRPLASLQASLAYLRAARPLYRQMFQAAWAACQATDLLVIGLPTFWGETLAEAFGIPLVWAPLQPLTPTTAFASALLPFRASLGGGLNRFSHQAVLAVTRLAWLGEINTWRRSLGLGRYDWLRPPTGAPHIYGISRHVLPRPPDWPVNHHLAGFWLTQPPADYRPPPALLRFLDAGDPPVYIGFGSMAQTARLSMALIETAHSSGQRLVAAIPPSNHGLDLPANLFPVGEIPHSWLFARLGAAIHHGGAGTTAASLQAGLPTAITPVGVDQFFWGERTWRSGLGPRPVAQRLLDAQRLAGLLDDLTHSPVYRACAAALAKNLAAEDGVSNASALIKALL